MSEASDKLLALMAEHNIVIDSVFVPFSKSRKATLNPKVGDLSLNWRVTLKHRDRVVYSADYTAGVAHCPSYKQSMHSRLTVSDYEALHHECEHGTRARVAGSTIVSYDRVKLQPDTASVMSSLLLDAEAIDYATYESYAREWDMDVDSRKGEAMYRVCLECGLALRAAFGDTLLNELRELAREL